MYKWKLKLVDKNHGRLKIFESLKRQSKKRKERGHERIWVWLVVIEAGAQTNSLSLQHTTEDKLIIILFF